MGSGNFFAARFNGVACALDPHELAGAASVALLARIRRKATTRSFYRDQFPEFFLCCESRSGDSQFAFIP
jgi:hypothetical protein